MKELDDWVRALADEVGIDPGRVDVEAVLDLAGEAAHAVVRPAAPVTTFVAGYVLGLAAARRAAGAPTSDQDAGLSDDDVLDRIAAFARAWTPRA